jgi:hypothetical protein
MRPAVFVGLRGMGKTALLRRCLSIARDDGAVVVAIEASGSAPMAEAIADGIGEVKRDVSITERVRSVVKGLRSALPSASFDLPNDMGKIELALRDPSQRAPVRTALDDLNDVVRRRDRYLVIAIDEIQEANLDDLRDVVIFVHAAAGTPRPVAFFGAGLTNSAAHLHEARTYTERWRYPRLGRLDRNDTIAAISVPAEKQGVKFSEDALELLVAETAGYPFFIQEYASVVWTFTEGPTIDIGDIEGRIAGVRTDLDEQFYAPRFARLTDRECAYALALASLGEGAHPVNDVAHALGARSSSVSSIRNQLIKKDVIFASGPGVVEFRMPLTDRFIERNRSAIERRARGSEWGRRFP